MLVCLSSALQFASLPEWSTLPFRTQSTNFRQVLARDKQARWFVNVKACLLYSLQITQKPTRVEHFPGFSDFFYKYQTSLKSLARTKQARVFVHHQTCLLYSLQAYQSGAPYLLELCSQISSCKGPIGQMVWPWQGLSALQFASKERAYQSGAPSRLFLFHKYQTILKSLARDKQVRVFVPCKYCIEGISETPNASADFYCQSNTNNRT